MAIYFADCKGPKGDPLGAIKIGYSSTPDIRCRRMLGSYPFQLNMIGQVPGGFLTEKMCHLELQKHRINLEFFHSEKDVTEFVENALRRGKAFDKFEDKSSRMEIEPNDILNFLSEYKITIERVCQRLGVRPDYFSRNLQNSMYKNNRLVAAAALEALNDGYTVEWPVR